MTTSAHDAHDVHDDDDRAHGDARTGDALGPIDVIAWGAGALGVILGLVVAVCFVLATATISG